MESFRPRLDNLAVLTIISTIVAVLMIGQVSSLPAGLKVGPVSLTSLSIDELQEIARGYTRMSVDDPMMKELGAFATEHVRKQQKSRDWTLKATVFALKQLVANSKLRNYKLTLVLIKTGKKTLTRSLLCNVDLVYGTPADQRQAKSDCIQSNIVSGIRAIGWNGTIQEDADLAASIFAANELGRLSSTMSDNSSSSTLVHYTASTIEKISGTEYQLAIEIQSPNNDILHCTTNIFPRKPRMLNRATCRPTPDQTESTDASFSETQTDGADVEDAADFAVTDLTQRRCRNKSDRLQLIRIERAWKKPVRGIQRRLRLTLSHEGESQPLSYCHAVVFEDRLSNEYQLVTSPGTSICSSTPPTD